MTNITLFWGESRGEKELIGLESNGHSGFSIEGEDVVCAAVSSLIQALIIGIRDVACFADEDIVCKIDSSVPLIRVKWKNERASGITLLTQTIALSLKEIALIYSDYVCIWEVYS
ncbi:hypothetical protein FACS1894204_08310 [Synergistales bacterium]|nr:hypothetical protein FACS1894204_08310 [Synergistales bacterium]